MPFVVSVALLGVMVASAGAAQAAPSADEAVHQVKQCTYGLLFDASRLTCDLAQIVDPN
jgi:hypothetical protein